VIAYRVRPAEEADAPGIRALFQRAYGQPWPEEEWTWKFLRNPDGWFGVVAESDAGEIVGNFSGWPMQFVIEGKLHRVYSAGDVATAPAARGLAKGRNVYGDMATAFYDAVAAEGVPFTIGFPHPRAHEISRRLGRTRDYFPIREILVDCASLPPAPEGALTGDFVDEEFDRLWETASRSPRHGPVRDRARTNWRFHARPTRYYRMVRITAGSEDLAWAPLSVVGEEALVADYLDCDPDGGHLPGLFAACGEEARRLGARRLKFWQTPGDPGRRRIAALGGQVRDAGFWIVGRVFDERVARAYLECGQLVASIFDVV
jgi:hypothetical protein